MRHGEDHAACRAVDQLGHFHADLAVHIFLSRFHHHHRAVIQVADALIGIAPWLDDADGEFLAGDIDRAHGIGQRVDIQHVDALGVGDLIEIEVVGNQRGVELDRQRHQFGVHSDEIRRVVIDDFDGQIVVALQFVELGQPAPTAIAPQGIGRIGHAVQLAQHKTRDHQRPADEAGFGDFDDAAVNQDTGIQKQLAVGVGLQTPLPPHDFLADDIRDFA